MVPCEPEEYSTAIAAAFEVVGIMQMEWSFQLTHHANGWDCDFGPYISEAGARPAVTGGADNAPEAINIAALRAKGHEVIL